MRKFHNTGSVLLNNGPEKKVVKRNFWGRRTIREKSRRVGWVQGWKFSQLSRFSFRETRATAKAIAARNIAATAILNARFANS